MLKQKKITTIKSFKINFQFIFWVSHIKILQNFWILGPKIMELGTGTGAFDPKILGLGTGTFDPKIMGLGNGSKVPVPSPRKNWV